MSDRLRDRRAVDELTAAPQPIEFTEKLQEFKRLAAALRSDLAALEPAQRPTDWQNEPVTGELRFAAAAARDGLARDGLATLTGRAQTTVTSVCQRCLQPFRWPLAATLEVVLWPPSQTSAGMTGADVWELDDETVRPIDIVDEALVMAMPLSARHEDDAACVAGSVQDDKAKTTPFATLRAQMDERQKN